MLCSMRIKMRIKFLTESILPSLSTDTLFSPYVILFRITCVLIDRLENNFKRTCKCYSFRYLLLGLSKTKNKNSTMQRKMYTRVLERVKSLRASNRLFSSHTDNNDADNRRRFVRQSQGLHAFRPEECPENPTIILFPGQGSQFVGMAKSLVNIPEAMEMFEIASDILRYTIQLFKDVEKKKSSCHIVQKICISFADMIS